VKSLVKQAADTRHKVHRFGVHRFGVRGQGDSYERRWGSGRDPSRRLTHKALCGVILGNHPSGGPPNRAMPIAVEDSAFRWLPTWVQCDSCENKRPYLIPTTETARRELHLELEVWFQWLARLGAEVEAVPHAARGCWFGPMPADVSFVPMPLCLWCRVPSWTDPRRWEWDIASALGGVDKYCYRHVCSNCRIGFRTERPRGAVVECGTCRGKPDRQQKEELRYAEPRRSRIGSGYPGGGVER
jgi:hypothetical protein